MKKRILVAVTMLTLLASQAFALSYDANVTPVKPNGDVLFGSGNANGGWTVDLSNNVEVGLRTHVRMPTPLNQFNSNGNGTYSYASGVIAGKALWNFDFSIDLNQGGNSSWDKNNVKVELGFDKDSSAGRNIIFFNPLAAYNDNAGNGTTTFQNSENFAWGYGDALLGPATWDFVLRVSDLNGRLLAETDMSVLIDGGAPAAPVPEPGTMMLLGLGMGGLAIYGKRRKSNKA